MNDDDDVLNDNSEPIVVTQGDKNANGNSDDSDDDDDVPPNETNFLKVKKEKEDDPDNDDTPKTMKEESVDLIEMDDEDSIMEVDPTTILDIDKAKENPFIHDFPFPFPIEASSIEDMYCEPDDVHIAVLQRHLVRRICGRDQPWRIKAYDTFCKHRKLHMHELHNWECSMVENAINKVGAPPITGQTKLRDQLTLVHVS